MTCHQNMTDFSSDILLGFSKTHFLNPCFISMLLQNYKPCFDFIELSVLVVVIKSARNKTSFNFQQLFHSSALRSSYFLSIFCILSSVLFAWLFNFILTTDETALVNSRAHVAIEDHVSQYHTAFQSFVVILNHLNFTYSMKCQFSILMIFFFYPLLIDTSLHTFGFSQKLMVLGESKN